MILTFKYAMKSKVNSSTYNDYLNFLKNKNSPSFFNDSCDYLKKYSIEKRAVDFIPCATYILNYKTQQYLYISEECKNIFGYTAEEISKKGLAFQYENIHPEDKVVFSGKLFAKFIKYNNSLPIGEHDKSRFSLNCRYKRKDNVYIQILQQYKVLETDKKGNPLICLGICSDITSYKSDDKVVFSIYSECKKNGFKIVSSESFFNKSIIISKREREILKHILHGLNSSKIAEKLNVSLYTVNAHRRNLNKKTNCKNSAELFNYALARGLV